MAIPEFRYHRPTTIAAACELGRAYGAASRFLAGGTELLVDLRNKRDQADHLISLRDIPELRRIQADADGLKIGALATLTAVAESPLITDTLPALREAVLTMAGLQIRNQGTIGGNFCRAVPCADTPPICIAAGASLRSVGAAKERILAAEDFFVGPRATVLQPDEILVEVQIPPRPRGFGARYERFSLRRGSALAVASVAAAVVLAGDQIKDVRVVLGSVAPVPLLVAACGQELIGRTPSHRLFQQAGQTAAAAAQPITDLRGSAEFRRHLVAVLTTRALTIATARARGVDA